MSEALYPTDVVIDVENRTVVLGVDAEEMLQKFACKRLVVRLKRPITLSQIINAPADHQLGLGEFDDTPPADL